MAHCNTVRCKEEMKPSQFHMHQHWPVICSLLVADPCFHCLFTGQIHLHVYRWDQAGTQAGQYCCQSQCSLQAHLCKACFCLHANWILKYKSCHISLCHIIYNFLYICFVVNSFLRKYTIDSLLCHVCSVADAGLWCQLGCVQHRWGDELFQIYI